MISRHALAKLVPGEVGAAVTAKNESGSGFDMESYLSKHGFEGVNRKPWQSNPGGFIYALKNCPFCPDHTRGCAAMTMDNGTPGFCCKGERCKGKTIRDLFALYPPDRASESVRRDAIVLKIDSGLKAAGPDKSAPRAKGKS